MIELQCAADECDYLGDMTVISEDVDGYTEARCPECKNSTYERIDS